jgi:hypothetical protein
MGLMDTIKGWFGGNKAQLEQGIDKSADVVKDKVPDEHDAKVDQVADKAKDVIGDRSGESGPNEPGPGQPA